MLSHCSSYFCEGYIKEAHVTYRLLSTNISYHPTALFILNWSSCIWPVTFHIHKITVRCGHSFIKQFTFLPNTDSEQCTHHMVCVSNQNCTVLRKFQTSPVTKWTLESRHTSGMPASLLRQSTH